MGKSVIVLGAGSSAEFDFPLNEGLKNEILRNLKTQSVHEENPEIRELIEVGFKRKEIFDFCHYLEGDYGDTIDDFLTENEHFWTLGKHVIAQALIRHENPLRIRQKSSAENWCRVLIKNLGTSLSDFNRNDLSFITFNYDRSLEYALLDGLASRYLTKPTNEIIKTFQKVKIVHVHGMLGNLQYGFGEENHVVTNCGGGYRTYTNNKNATQVTTAAEGIKIVHEGLDDSKNFSEARKLLADAENVVFIGFGFGKKNFERLSRNGTFNDKKFIRYNMLKMDPDVAKYIESITLGLITGGHVKEGNTLKFLNSMISEKTLFDY